MVFLYELAAARNIFIHDHCDTTALFNLVTNFHYLTEAEIAFLRRISSQTDIPLQNICKSPIYVQLKQCGVLTSTADTVYFCDMVVFARVITSNESIPVQVRSNNLCGYGLESMTRSLYPLILQHLKIPVCNHCSENLLIRIQLALVRYHWDTVSQMWMESGNLLTLLYVSHVKSIQQNTVSIFLRILKNISPHRNLSIFI
eukprot:TRINITY_DN7807_c0_g1_i1.p1 TRINITY_DN7807_c0_g1~~TRINITY_DN7807_c0_g1_i1.p1  ORF type:complete len:201 (-),score=20.26 TRINITY_DN7807_c0_g1_i1:648-1250(-)